MNPWPVVLADLRSLRWIAWIAPLLVAIAVSVGVALSAQERGLRHATAQAASDFDLLIGSPGSQTQLVLTAVYLQPEALPLVDGEILAALTADPRAKGAAPIALGDIARGYPIVGTTSAFVTRWGRLKPAGGRVFERDGEAVVGADVQLAIGDAVTPSHAHTGQRHPFGTESLEEAHHRHEGVSYPWSADCRGSVPHGTGRSSFRSRACGKLTGWATAMPPTPSRSGRPSMPRKCRACRRSS